jgi:hypothetical protein
MYVVSTVYHAMWRMLPNVNRANGNVPVNGRCK